MERRPITADLVARADRLLEYAVKPGTVARRLGISPYVIRLIVRDKTRYLRPVPPPRPDEPAPDPRRSTDAVTIRMIQRMLAINWLDYAEIGREVGVSQRLVERVAAGRRLAISTEQHMLDKEFGEHAVRVPVRCPECHAMISVVPCRACRARNKEQEPAPGLRRPGTIIPESLLDLGRDTIDAGKDLAEAHYDAHWT